jgi:hypothetical protein
VSRASRMRRVRISHDAGVSRGNGAGVVGWREVWRARHRDAAALALVALFFVAFFSWVFFTGKLLVGGDAFVYNYPLRAAAWDAVRHGQLPLWTPTVFSGYPLLSMSQLALGYPLTWGYAILPGGYAEELFVLAPFLLAPAFTYFYARQIERSRLAALLAAFTFAYGGLMISPLTTGGMQTNGMMWLPLILIAIERARHSRFAACLAGASAAYAMSVLTGHGQSFLYVAILANAYGAFLSLIARRVRRRAWQPLAVSALATVLGASVGAFQILETMRAQRRSIRSSLDFAYFVGGSFTPRAWLWSLAAPLYMDKSVDVTPYVPPLALLLATLAAALYFRKARRGDARRDNARDVSSDAAHDEQRDDARDARHASAHDARDAQHDSRRDPRILFWLAVAVVSALLMLGDSTPLARLLFHVPVINLFRYPCRHALEWTFAVATLAAYGCDTARVWFERRLRYSATQPASGASAHAHGTTDASERDTANARMSGAAEKNARGSGVALALLATAALVGLLWWVATGTPPGPGLLNVWYVGLSRRAYLVWKFAFVVLTLAAFWRCASVAGARRRAMLLTVAVVIACFFEPFIAGWHWWHLFAKTPARFSTPAATTRFLAAHEPTRNRAYIRVNLDVEEFTPAPLVDGANTAALYGVENVAGFEHLILSRYSRALGNVWSDGVNPRPGFPPDDQLLDAHSHVLDLLNTTYLVTYPQLSKLQQATIARGDLLFASNDLGVALAPGQSLALDARRKEGDVIALVTTLGNSVNVADGERVATMRVFDEGGRVFEQEIRAGTDTAEWAHDRADVRDAVRHRRAPIFDSTPGDAAAGFEAHRYVSLFPLKGRVRASRVEIANACVSATVNVSRATLYDTATKRSTPLSNVPALGSLDETRWRIEYDDGGAIVARNLRALPRAWLVNEAEAVDGEESLRRIRGEGGRAFDPRRTALLEVRPEELPTLPAISDGARDEAQAATRIVGTQDAARVIGRQSASSVVNVQGATSDAEAGGDASVVGEARVVEYEANRIVVETDARTPSVLVVSEIFYPGWEARVDGRVARISLADYLLRSVAVPAGRHRVEMRYAAPAARHGAIISALALAVLCALAVGRRVRRGRRVVGLAK